VLSIARRRVIKKGCQYTECTWRRHPGSQSNAVIMQGVLGEGTLVQFVDHCNLIDGIQILKWTQVSVALGDFVALCSIRRWVSWTFLVWSSAGQDDQDGCCLCAFEMIISLRYQECMLVGRSK